MQIRIILQIESIRMKKAKSKQSAPVLFESKKNYNILQWILISVRLFIVCIVLGSLLFIQKYVCPLIFISLARRYVHCLANLIHVRIILLCLGYFRFQCENFRFFHRGSPKFTLKSGYIGIGTHKNIIDFLFYSYLINPVFVRLIMFSKEFEGSEKTEIYYAPLSFYEALTCALTYRGFEPMIVKSQSELKKIKYRKMAMKTLISECFEQIQGSIFILLPSVIPNQFISINSLIANDIHENQNRFERSGVGFNVDFHQNPKTQKIYPNQIDLVKDLMSEFKLNSLSLIALTFRKYKNQYIRQTYGEFINNYYKDCGLSIKPITYEDYKNQMDRLQKQNPDIFQHGQQDKPKHSQIDQHDQTQKKYN